MIDRQTAIHWAMDVGFVGGKTTMVATPEEIQALITRARNEAYELAIAACLERPEPDDDPLAFDDAYSACAYAIRALKQRQ